RQLHSFPTRRSSDLSRSVTATSSSPESLNPDQEQKSGTSAVPAKRKEPKILPQLQAKSTKSADRLLVLLDVGKTPLHLALKPDGGEIFVSNFDSNTVSEIITNTNEVSGSYLIGKHPVRGLVSGDNSILYVSNFGSDSIGVYSIDDGKLIGTVNVGSHPDAMALRSEEHTSELQSLRHLVC